MLAAGTAALAGALAAAPAQAQPSFDCTAATLPAEISICAEPALAKLDRQIATVYFALLESARPTQAAQIRHEQRAFLRDRNACSAAETPLALCLETVMRTRLEALEALHADVAGTPLTTGGEVTTAPGVVWRAARPGDLPADAFRLDDDRALCAVGLPARPLVGTAGESGCAVARSGAGVVEAAFSVLIADAAGLAWVPAAGVAEVPATAITVWRDGAQAVQVCRARIADATHVGTLNLGNACAVLVGAAADAAADEVLVLAGFDVLARSE